MKLTAQQVADGKTSLYKFMQLIYPDITGGQLEKADHFQPICSAMECIFMLDTNRLLLNMPTGFLKTTLGNMFIAWAHGWNPGARSITVNASADIAKRTHSTVIKNIMLCPSYKQIFPDVIIGRPKKSEFGEMYKSGGSDRQDFFETTAGGFIFSCGMESRISGLRFGRGWKDRFGGVLFIDDPHDLKEGMVSKVARERAWDNYRTKFRTRRNRDFEPEIISHQRLHFDDLTGKVSRTFQHENWQHVKIKALVEDQSTWKWKTSADYLIKEKLANPHVFSAQYQQEPLPDAGNLLDLSWFPRYEKEPGHFMRVIDSWDTAYKIGQHNDPSACIRLGQSHGKYYILDVFCKKLLYPELRQQVIRNYIEGVLRYGVSYIGGIIEDKASGQSLLQELNGARCVIQNKNVKVTNFLYGKVTTIAEFGLDTGPASFILTFQQMNPEADKVTRMTTESAVMRAGQVALPLSATWLLDTELELQQFPESDHDDRADALSQGLRYFRNSGIPSSTPTASF